MGVVGKAIGQPKPPERKGRKTMYWIKDKNGRRQPRANAPRAEITNLQEVFAMLDAGTDPCIAHAEYANGDMLDVEIPSNYARNSIGRKTRIRGNELFIKRLNVDLAYLARYEWGRTHQWDESELGSWTDAIGAPFDETLADRDIAARLQPVFPESDIAGWLDLYSIRRGWAPVPSTADLIRALLHERENAPLRQRRPAKSGIAYETLDSEYGGMGVARDKRTGQTWMWPMNEERNFYVWCRNQDVSLRLDRHDIKRAMDEELRRGGLPESFDYPCHAPDGMIVWCHWDGLGDPDNEEHPIMMGEKPDAKKVGTLARRTDKDGLRWWRWTDSNGVQGERFPSYEQTMLDFIDSTDLGLRHY